MMTDWSLDIEAMSWVEHTTQEVDFVVKALDLSGDEHTECVKHCETARVRI